MFKLIAKLGEKEIIQVFAEEKLAVLYKDYHIRFGQWASHFSWIREDLATTEDKKLVVDEKNEFVDGVIFKHLLCGKDIEISIEQVNAKTPKNRWKELRDLRDSYLKETDWTQLGDTELSPDLKKLYRQYRNYLRVLPTLHSDSSIGSAKVCTFIEWRSGER